MSRFEIVSFPQLSINYSGHRDIIHPPKTFWLKIPLYILAIFIFSIIGSLLFWVMEKGPSQHEKDKYDTCHESVSPVRKCLRDYSKEPLFFNFTTGFGYAISVYTTVGYGDLVPRSDLGKIMTIVYGTIGIPLYLALLADSLENVSPCVMRSIRFVHRRIFLRRWDEKLSRLEEFDVPCWIKFVLAVVPWVSLFYTGIIMMTNGLGDKTNFMEALHFSYASIAFIGFGDIVPTYDWKFIVIHLPIIFIGQVTTYSRFYYIQTFYRTKILQVTGLFTDQKAKCNSQCSIMSHCDISTKEPFVNPFKK